MVRLQKKQGVITEGLRRRIKDFGKERPKQEIKLEREEQKVRHKEKRIRYGQVPKNEQGEAADPAGEVEEEEESLSLPEEEEETSGVRLKSAQREESSKVRLRARSRSPVRQPRTPEGSASDPRYKARQSGLGPGFGAQSPNRRLGKSTSSESAHRELEVGKSLPGKEDSS